MPDAPVLSVRNLRVEFPTRRGTLVAVDDVSSLAFGQLDGLVVVEGEPRGQDGPVAGEELGVRHGGQR